MVVGSSSDYSGYDSLFIQFVTGNRTFDDYDAFGTIGRGRILNPKYRFNVKKNTHWIGSDTYDVESVDFECSIEDLYDFNYEDGDLPAHAAALQIGYGNGNATTRANHGKIYCHRIDISTTYPIPFTYQTIISP